MVKHWYLIEGLRSKEELESLIAKYGSATNIAGILGCSRQTVSKAMKKYQLIKKRYIISDETKRRFNLP